MSTSRALLFATVAAVAVAAFLAGVVVARPAVAADRTVVCSEPVTGVILGGDKWRAQQDQFMNAQLAAGKANFMPITIQGTLSSICAW